MSEKRQREIAYGQQRDCSAADRIGAHLSNRKLFRYMKKVRPATVLDIGCGYHAEFLRRAAPLVQRTAGVDLKVNPALAEPYGLVEIRIDRALPMFETESFDFAVMNNVLEHLRHPEEILGEAHRVLAPGGMLYLNVPNWRGKRWLEFAAFTLKWSDPLEMDDHKMYYSPRELWPMVVRAGFRPSGICMGTHKLGLCTYCWAQKKQ